MNIMMIIRNRYGRIFFWGVLFCVMSLSSTKAQEKKGYQLGIIGFYNLENLFDTVDDPNINDEEFLPKGRNQWGTMKYTNKQNKMSAAIARIGENIAGQEFRCPDILGVSEIENKKVLEDLVNMPALRKYNFGIVHHDGPDRRGVDVALIYQKDKFKVLSYRSVFVYDSVSPNFLTRDQLLVSGIYMEELIHIIVNHWPSRSGGEARSAPKRALAADVTRSIVDSLLQAEPAAKIIIMGDLNDDPTDKSVREHLKAKVSDVGLQKGDLFNTSAPLFEKGHGTLAYNGSWNLFDQIIISESLNGKNTRELKVFKSRIFKDPMLLEKDGPYKGQPLRTHAGGRWLNGYSDHFPVYLMMIKENNIK